MEGVLILALAVALDAALGDPPTSWHPVGWLGRMIGMLVAHAPTASPRAQLAYGASVVLFVLACCGLISYAVLNALASWHTGAYIIVGALILKSSFALKGLLHAGSRVKAPLAAGDLPAARHQLRALVSRDTSQLHQGHVAAATIESLAENAVDSFIAPIFYFTLFAAAGPLAISAALCYRAANTLDAMVGYHGRFEYLGKVAARLDDALNFLPARLGGLSIVLVAATAGHSRRAWRTLSSDHSRTESPNAGWTMSAMAGALGVRLEKIDHYSLGRGPEPDASHIERARQLTWAAGSSFVALCAIILAITG